MLWLTVLRRSTLPKVAIVLCVAAMSIGCSAQTPATLVDPIGQRGGQLATEAPFVCPTGQMCVLTGHAVFGTLRSADGCIWMVIEGSGQEVRVVWPNGYSASYDPLVIRNAAGREVARDGTVLHADGWGPTIGAADGCGRTSSVSVVDGFQASPAASP